MLRLRYLSGIPLLCLITFVASLTLGRLTYFAAAQPTGLVAAYSFDEGAGTTVGDASGAGNTGTLVNATWTATGKYGKALVFNGTSARVTVNDAVSLRLTTAMTLEAWVNPSTVTGAWRDVIYKGNDNYYLEGTSSPNGAPAAGGTFGTTYGTGPLAANTWTHLAVTYDRTTLRLYVNGVQVSSVAQTGSIATSTNSLQIGGDSIYGQYFQGMIDEVRVYNVARTAAQIQTDMSTPIGSVTPDTTPPSAPTNLTATAVSGTQVNLSWGAATDNVGVTGYRVERCQGAGCTSFAQIGTSTGTTYSDIGLTASTTYRYQARATDAAVNSGPYSNIASGTTTAPDTDPPTAPGTLTATAVSGTQVNLSWGAATDNVGVTGYRVERCQGAGCTSFAQIATPTGTTYSDAAVAMSTTYRYQVRATDAAQNLGPYSNIATLTTLATVPGLVAAYSFDEGAGTTVGDASGAGNTGTLVNATWTATGKYGKALVFNGTSARVTVNDAVSLRLTTAMTLEAWVNPSTVTGAWRDVIYKGNDNYYLEGTSSPNGAPAAGGTFGTTYGTGPLAANTWTHLAVTYDRTTLRLYVNGVQVSSVAQTGSIATSTNSLQIGGDSIYGQYFQGMIDEVRVYNVARTAAQIQTDMSTPIGSVTPDTTPPSAPTNLTATAVSGTQVNLSWGAATDNVGVTGYRVERCQGAGCTSFAQIGTSTGTTYSDIGLTASTTYRYQARATDAAVNSGPYSNIASGTTTAPDTDPPTAPGTLTATAVSGTQVNLSWGAATDNVGVTGYRVERCQGAGCTDFVKIATPPSTTYSDIGLTPNTAYGYLVRATDAAQNLGPYSNIATLTTLATVPELVAAYSFDEGSGATVVDTSGHGNNGTLENATWTAAGKYGKALVFNGTSARVTVNDAVSLRLTTAMTLEAWVNPSTVTGAWRDVIYKGNDNYYLEGTSSLNGAPAAGGTFGTTYGTGPLAANTWTHLAVTYDGVTLRLYVNGTQVSTAPGSGSIVTSPNSLQIGGDSIYGQYFQGMIDEVRVYNAARTPAQIQLDMNTPIGLTSLPVASLSPTSIDFGSQSTGTVSDPQTVRLTNIGGVTLTFGSITVGGLHAGDFAQTNTCGSTLAPGANCVITVRFAPTATGTRSGLLTISSNAAGTPHTVALSGMGLGFAVTPQVAVLTRTQTQLFSAPGGSIVWSVDGVAGGSATSGTITTAGLYTPPSVVGTHTVTANVSGQPQLASATVYVTGHPGTFTYHNDNLRTGQNPNEIALTPDKVNSTTFGKLFSYSLDGAAYASPLYVADLNIPGVGFRNVVYVATEHNTLYAFDADGLSAAPLWRVSFVNPAGNVTPVPANDTGECCDIAPEIGITGTPVIDPGTGTLYVVAKTKEGNGGNARYVQRLHAVDIRTGAEKFGGPVEIQASVPGTGTGTQGGQVAFNPLRENQRPALLLNNGVVYLAFGSHGDQQPYHGWLLGYNATTLQRVLVFNTSPNGTGAGVWMSNAGPAADVAGNIYIATANGTFDNSLANYGDSFVKLHPNGTVLDYFTPKNESVLEADNADLASGGVLLLPDQPGAHPHLLVHAGKNETIYLIDRDAMGHFDPNDDGAVQVLENIFPFGTPEPGNYSAPVYFNGTVYFSPVSDTVQAFRLTNGQLSTSPTSQSAAVYGYPGGTLAISANSGTAGILWAIERTGAGVPGVLRAYNPANLAQELYHSNQAGTRDALDEAVKFSVPLVANGKVFVGSIGRLTVYGLLP